VDECEPLLVGNQFLPKTFYATMSSIFRHAEYFKRFAAGAYTRPLLSST
jgi:hypothetical protein